MFQADHPAFPQDPSGADQKELMRRLKLLERQHLDLSMEMQKNSNQLVDALEQEEAEAAEKNLFAFYQASWSVFEGDPFVANWHHEALAEALEAIYYNQIDNLIVQMPPGTGKSTMCNVAFPAWVWLQDPSIRFMTPSVTDKLSFRDSIRTKDVISSPWYQKYYGHKFKLDRNVNAKGFWRNDKQGYRLAGGLRGQGIGERYDIGIVDDPHKPGETVDGPMKDFVWEWWVNLFSMREAPLNARKVVIHQRLAVDDLIGRLLEAEAGNWEVLNLPMYYEPKAFYAWTETNFLPNRDPRQTETDLLFPQAWDAEKCRKKAKLLGPYGAPAQFQQRPVNLEGGLVKSKWFKNYSMGNRTSFFNTTQLVIGSWDLSFGETGGSYCVGQVWGIRNGNQKYLIDEYRGKWEFPQQKAAIKQMLKDYPQIRTLLIEKKANGEALVSSLQKEIASFATRGVNLIPVKVHKSKEIRLYQCLSDFEAGNVVIPTSTDKSWVDEYITELINFPVSSTDDRVDATTQALNWFAENASSLKYIVFSQKDYERIEKENTSHLSSRQVASTKFSTRNIFDAKTTVKSLSNMKEIFSLD